MKDHITKISLAIVFVLMLHFDVAFADTATEKTFLKISNELVETQNFQELKKMDSLKIASKSTTTKAIILTYHSVRDFEAKDSLFAKNFITGISTFDKEMKYLKDNGFTVISPADLVRLIESGATSTQKYIIITFDDGYLSNYINAAPILEKYNLHATFFIYSDAISKFSVSMTWDNLKDLLSKGNTIGGHTKSHPQLTKIKNEKILEYEILGNKKVLEENLGTKIDFFAYPYGLRNPLIIQKVKDAGYLGAMIDARGSLHTKKSLYEMNRINMNNDYDAFLKFVNLK